MKILTITKFKLLLSVVICLLVESCDTKQNGKIYQISQDNNNLYITMPHPTIGIVGINEVSWRGVDLDELTNDIYTTLKKQHLSDIYSLYVKFETTSTDKYGNVEKSYKEAFLFEVPVEEVRKYKDYKYFGNSYDLTGKLREAAFTNNVTIKLSQDGVSVKLPKASTNSVVTSDDMGDATEAGTASNKQSGASTRTSNSSDLEIIKKQLAAQEDSLDRVIRSRYD